MFEFIIGTIFIFVAICCLLVAVPFVMKCATEAEGKPDHFYNIFMTEAGWRGRHITSAVGCFLPIYLVLNPPDKIEFLILSLFLVSYCFYEHAKLYKGLKIFNSYMLVILAVVVTFVIALNVAYLNKGIGSVLLTILSVMVSIFWGALVNFKRTKIILHNKSLQHQSLRSLDGF